MKKITKKYLQILRLGDSGEMKHPLKYWTKTLKSITMKFLNAFRLVYCVSKTSIRPTMAEVISYLSNPSVDVPYPGEPTNTMHKKILKKMVAGEFSTSSTFINQVSSSIQQSSTPSLDSF
ncbi:hypothetical protein V8G54_029684 [Vigna mungo]|uniref:Uncharacterized protein n=1 Tax=Vigna mungo TaxID=3915 RepID=A0AAQ3RJE0_VIGMU